MGLKRRGQNACPSPLFEKDVNMYGSQALLRWNQKKWMFEKDVNMYGSQAFITQSRIRISFEKDVNMYGSQAPADIHPCR